MDLITKFADPSIIQSLTFGEKMIGALIVTIMGMGVTYIALIAISLISRLMSKIINQAEVKGKKADVVIVNATQKKSAGVEESTMQIEQNVDDITPELVAAITAAIAVTLGTQNSKIIVRNIRRIGDTTPVWGSVGRREQMANRF